MNRFWFEDDLLGRFPVWYPYYWTITTTGTQPEIIDFEKFDVINGEKVPRKDYRDRLLEENKKKLKELDETYEKRKKEIASEREKLLKGK
jgi:hypothetical protein